MFEVFRASCPHKESRGGLPRSRGGGVNSGGLELLESWEGARQAGEVVICGSTFGNLEDLADSGLLLARKEFLPDFLGKLGLACDVSDSKGQITRDVGRAMRTTKSPPGREPPLRSSQKSLNEKTFKRFSGRG